MHSLDQSQARHSYFVAVILSALLVTVGCDREQARIADLHQQNRAMAEEKLSQIERVAADAQDRPEVDVDFLQYADLQQQIETYERIVADPESDQTVREGARLALDTMREKRDELTSRIAFDVDQPVRFRNVLDGDQGNLDVGNAQTLVLDENGSFDRLDEEIIRRNVRGADWLYCDGISNFVNSESGFQLAYTKMQALEYLLVIKPREIERPTYEGNSMFNLGAMVAEAHLYSIDDGRHLGAIVFAAATQELVPGVPDITLNSDDHEGAIESLTDRLYADTHKFAHAAVAEIADNISGPYRINRRPFLGHVLEEIEDLPITPEESE